jgi:hypothetical protein
VGTQLALKAVEPVDKKEATLGSLLFFKQALRLSAPVAFPPVFLPFATVLLALMPVF